MPEAQLEARVAKLEGRVDGFEGRFDSLERRFDRVERRIEALDQKVSKQFYWLVGAQVTVLVSVIGVLAGALFLR